MKVCGAVHPTQSALSCGRPGSGAKANHAEHTGTVGDEFIDWPNVAYKAPEKRKEGNKNKGILEAMASRVKQETPAHVTVKHYIPSEADARGRVALYLLKYLNEWIGLDELQMDTVAGSAADNKLQELINIGWPIQESKGRYRLTKDPRKPLWNAVPGTVPVP
jgi:hypothetical protein